MNYLLVLREILLGLKAPKIDWVAPLTGKKHRDVLLLAFNGQQTFLIFSQLTDTFMALFKKVFWGFLHSSYECEPTVYEL